METIKTWFNLISHLLHCSKVYVSSRKVFPVWILFLCYILGEGQNLLQQTPSPVQERFPETLLVVTADDPTLDQKLLQGAYQGRCSWVYWCMLCSVPILRKRDWQLLGDCYSDLPIQAEPHTSSIYVPQLLFLSLNFHIVEIEPVLPLEITVYR